MASMSAVLMLSAGMKRSVSGRGELISSPASRASVTRSPPDGWPRSSASSSPRPRTGPKPWLGGELLQAFGEIGTGVHDGLEEGRARHFLEHRQARGAHERIAVVRAALVPMLEAAHGGLGEQRRQRHACADALAQGHDVGLDSGMLVAPELPGTPHAGLHFVGDEEQAALRSQLAQVAHERVGGG